MTKENKLRCDKILITGGGSGIGKAIAKRFIDAGAKVVIMGRNIEKLHSVKEEINSERLLCLQGDISALEKAEQYINEASELMGGLNGVVNNAGLEYHTENGKSYDQWEVTPEEWKQILDVNLNGTFFMIQAAVNYMKAHEEKGNILNISSNAACIDIRGPYEISKLIILRLTRALAKKCGDFGIVMNGIAPGATVTRMISSYCKGEDEPFPAHSIGRFIKPSEIAELAFYLMSDLGEIICGHTVIADGGDKKCIL